MSSSLDRAVKDFMEAIQESQSKKTNSFDTQGEVIRVDGDTAWVHFPGGVDETPVKLTIDAKAGDKVQVRVGGGQAWLVGNASSPPTDDTTALHATYIATGADEKASSAINSANLAKMAADLAEAAAAQAVEDADKASKAAAQAKQTTDEINAYAETAGKTVTQILNDGETAGTAAQQAKTAADNAIKGLGQVEDVVGTLNWITDHSKVTEDTTPQAGKSYYIKNQDGTFTLVTDVEGKNPAQEGWYELTEAVQNYILSHLALTNDGLYVMADDSHWKVRIADDGVYIIDDTNGQNKTVAKYKDAITLGNDDGTEAYMYEDRNSIRFYDEYAAKTFICENYSAGKVYSVGDIVKYYGNFFRCKIENSGNYPTIYSKYWETISQSPFFYVSELRGLDSYYTIQDRYIGDGNTVTFEASFVPELTKNTNNELIFEQVKVYQNGNEVTEEVSHSYALLSGDSSWYKITFTNPPKTDDIVILEYRSTSSRCKAFSMGSRLENFNVGIMSVTFGALNAASGAYACCIGHKCSAIGKNSHAEGRYAEAIGNHSHAEGESTKATGICSHAEGRYTEAIGKHSHAEGHVAEAIGDYSHAEGSEAKATGRYSYARGNMVEAVGIYSHAEGLGIIASRRCQMAIGEYNIGDSYSVFEIGNGDNKDDRSNAFSVDYGGMMHSTGLYLKDKTGFEYPIWDNGTNLWIGSSATAAQHHRGMTFISTGHDGSNGNKSIRVSVPNAANDGASNYDVLHTGYEPTTPTISLVGITTGSLNSINGNLYGKQMHLVLSFKNSAAVASGSNLFVGTIPQTAYRPKELATGVGYYGGAAVIVQIQSNGVVTARVTGATVPANSIVWTNISFLIP